MLASEPNAVAAPPRFISRENMTGKSPAKNYSRLAANAFAMAAEAGGGIEERFFKVGDCIIRLCFAGNKLQPVVLRALNHLAVPRQSEAEFTVNIADGLSCGVKLPLPEHGATSQTSAGITRHDDGKISALIQEDVAAISLVDAEEREGFFWTQDAARLFWHEAGSPLRYVFHLWFRQRRRQVVHAAAVGTPDGAVLIVGASGSGKSTTALACLGAGMVYLGDDYMLAGVEPEPRAWSLFCAAKVTDESLKRFPKLESFVQRRGTDGEKSLLFVDASPGFESVPLRAILWPRLSGKTETRITPLAPAKMLLAFAPSTILQMPVSGGEDFQTLARLVQKVPTYILEAGTDMKKLAGTIRQLLAP
jgi:hypothetical protein